MIAANTSGGNAGNINCHKQKRHEKCLCTGRNLPGQRRKKIRCRKRKSPYVFHRKGLNLLVAGKGFEPMTFGL